MDLFYCKPENVKADNILLEKEETHHVVNVFRKQKNEKIFVTDGAGNIFETQMVSLEDNCLKLRINSVKNHSRGTDKIIFCVPLLKNNGRFDFMLEKLTELGIAEIFPYFSRNSVVRDLEKKSRWQKLLIAAIKQCNIPFLPEINVPLPFNDLIEKFEKREIKKIVAKQGGANISELKNSFENKLKDFLCIVGPEGDLTEEEYKKLELSGFKSVSLGSNRLRAETAAISLSAILVSLNSV